MDSYFSILSIFACPDESGIDPVKKWPVYAVKFLLRLNWPLFRPAAPLVGKWGQGDFLEFGIWILFVIWCLEFSKFKAYPALQAVGPRVGNWQNSLLHKMAIFINADGLAGL